MIEWTNKIRSLKIFAGNDFSERNTTKPAHYIVTVGKSSSAFRKVICSKAQKISENHMVSIYMVLSIIVLSACVPTITSRYLTNDDIENQELTTSFSLNTKGQSCNQWSAYLPDTNRLNHIPIRFVRINLHWMNTSDTLVRTLSEYRAKEYSKGLIRAANYALRKNRKMYLPHGNDTPVLPIQMRVVLTPDPNQQGSDGIYFHYSDNDDEVFHVHRGKNRTIGRRDMFNKYGVQKDTVLNVFILPHHPDSVASPTYKEDGGGVALGNFIKLTGVIEEYEDHESYWDFRATLIHEIAHIYGLSHSWVANDGCEDTPPHVQDCFIRSQSAYCDTMTSNNIMDYVAEQSAFTPCQIGKMHYSMSRVNNRRRNYLLPAWCELKDSMHVRIQDTVSWDGAKDLEGHLTIQTGGLLIINCRVSMPPEGKITVRPGGVLILQDAHLHNDCNQLWKGINIQESRGVRGKVIFRGDPKLENMEFPLEP